jgi:hypothetical protein
MNLINTPEELLPEKLWSIEIGSYLTKHNTGFFKAKIARTTFLNPSEKVALRLIVSPASPFISSMQIYRFHSQSQRFTDMAAFNLMHNSPLQRLTHGCCTRLISPMAALSHSVKAGYFDFKIPEEAFNFSLDGTKTLNK